MERICDTSSGGSRPVPGQDQCLKSQGNPPLADCICDSKLSSEEDIAMSGPEKRQIRDIYVALLGKGNNAWRRVEAIYEGEDSYRIVSENEDTEERWEYTTGECVRCRSTTLPSGERVLVATERLHPRTDPGGK